MEEKEAFYLENITFSDMNVSHEFDNECVEFVKAFTSMWSDTSGNNSKISKRNESLSQNIISQRMPLSMTETKKDSFPNIISQRDPRDLKYWGLPEDITKKYESKGVKCMFPWQVECLNIPRVLGEMGNLVYSAPTSAGKTLVAEVLMVKTVLERRKKVIVILPFVSVVREKMFYFQDMLSDTGIRVEGFMGSHTPAGGLDSVNVAVCTIEKANNLVNRLLEDGRISELGAVVVDELHLVGDPHRGYILELLLTKLIYISKKTENVNIQIVGMSATLPNLDYLSGWLDAELYKTDFRPIKLEERCLISSTVYDSDFRALKELTNIPDLPADREYIVTLCLETLIRDSSVLIFCPTKNRCENLAQQIAAAFRHLGYKDSVHGVNLRRQLNGQKLNDVLEQLKSCPVGLDPILNSAISFGVAYHHAGLTMDERDIVESGFKSNAIRVLVATSTLSSGVNLPARRVIVRTPLFNYKPIDPLTYKQMIGRAGRMGIDADGESILMCSVKEKNIATNLMSGTAEPISSCLENEDRLMRAILEGIASEIALSKEDVELYISCTLLFNKSVCSSSLKALTEKTIEQLKEYELIRIKNENECIKYIATPLGKACLSSSMSPQDGLTLFIELQKARECFVLENDLHMIYLVTPYSICNQWGELNWLTFLNMWENLSPSMKRVGKLIGVQESFIYSCVRNVNKSNNPVVAKKYQIHKRFFTSLALQDLVNEVPLTVVANKFNCSRGMLQSLQQSSSTFAGMVTSFVHQLGWRNFEILVSQFQNRLYFGIHSELIDLMKLQSLNGLRARSLFDTGIETINDLAKANIDTVEKALRSAIPFESERKRDGENIYDVDQRNNLNSIWITGKKGVTIKTAATSLIQEARTYLEIEMGVKDIRWNSIDLSVTSDFCEDDPEIKEISIVKSDGLNIVNKDNVNNSDKNEKQTKSDDSSLRHSTPCQGNYKTDTMNSSDSGNITNNSLSDDSFFEKSISEMKSPKNATNDDRYLSTLNKSNGIFGSDTSKSLFEDSIIVDTQLDEILSNKTKLSSNVIIPNKISKSVESLSINRLDSLSLQNVFADSFTSLNGSQDRKINENTSTMPDNRTERKRKLSKDCENCDSDDFHRNKSAKIDDCDNQKGTLYSENFSQCYYFKHEIISISPILSGSNMNNPIKYDRLKIYHCRGDPKLFKSFTCWTENVNEMSLFVDTNKDLLNQSAKKIGINILNENSNTSNANKNCDNYIDNIVLYCGQDELFYIDLRTDYISEVQLEIVFNFLKKLLNKKERCVTIYGAKDTFLHLLKCGIEINCPWKDPMVGDWLLNADGLIKPLSKMASDFCPYISKSYKENDFKHFNAWIQWHVMKSIYNEFTEKFPEMLKSFDIEMDALKVLSRCEYFGLAVNKNYATKLLNQIRLFQRDLECSAFELTGRRFKFSSSSEVAKIMGLFNGRKTSTNKKVLEKINSPLAQYIIHWRKLNTILTKNVFPLVSKIKQSDSDRIYGSYWTHTSTGRITMQEPNLQNFPRNFTIPEEHVKKLNGKHSKYIFDPLKFNCRNIITSSPDHCLVSADYCQLELRLLAHMSDDRTLKSVINSNGDIFKAIASVWKRVKNEEVDDDLRQKAKQMCYGIIYGMGVKTLARSLEMNEIDAQVFIDTFHSAYPGIKKFVNKTIEKCKRSGYVETLHGRRRYLPGINCVKLAEQSHAERQAVNTTIQGSAADILKSVMISIQSRVEEVYKNASSDIKLVLLMHDELIYEIPSCELDRFTKIFKRCMENTINISVSLPVKIKSGKSWGDLKQITE